MVVAPPSTSNTKPKASKKEKRAENVDPEAQAISNPGVEKRKKKHHGVEADTQQVTTPIADDERPRKKKQRVEQNDINSDDEVTADNVDNTLGIESLPSAKPKREKRPKKPKDKTTKLSAVSEEASASVIDNIHIADIPVLYTNPLTDGSLPELSQRGLVYAYQYAQHVSLPSDTARAAQQPWKFNKGRQNWIIRNVTEPTVIPDSYLALTMAYVDSIKGGARNTLKKTCKTTIKEAKAAVEDQPEPDRQKPSGKAEEAESDKSTAKKVAFAAATNETTASALVNEEKRKRAKKILRVLRGKVEPQDI
ncbi:hypothetical protein FRC12_004516 [Ceratobasidium sp. 428]|nr:hypothetical protein FRC12_004516 [Ceratobasidium sp. 428]